MSLSKSSQAWHEGLVKTKALLLAFWGWTKGFCKRHRIGIIISLIATLIFFAPIIARIDSYSPGGDAMFNAWSLQRNQNCILGNNCPEYVDANIYYPNEDTMLYSEAQFSAGLLTLPLRLVSDNPIFAYNVWTIACFFFSALFMYLLVKHISRGRGRAHEFVAVLAGLIFAFAPFKMSAVYHMQNISIFFLPLAVLVLFKFFERKNKWYLAALLVILSLQFYASWYQMIFVLTVFAVLLLGAWVFRLVNWRLVLLASVTVLLAAATTLPLAKEYIRFSGETDAGFPISDQLLYQSSLTDYLKPHGGTLLGKLFYEVKPDAHRNAWNLDSVSYHGVVLYAVAGALLVVAYRRRKKSQEERKTFKWIVTYSVIAVIGFISSLGPLLKLRGSYMYSGFLPDGMNMVIPMPWLLVDVVLPQLAFIRALGRWSVLVLFVLCVLLAYLPFYLKKLNWSKRRRLWTYAVIGILAVIELAPLHFVRMSEHSFAYDIKIPGVYRYVKENPEVDNLVIIHGDSGYPGEQVTPFARSEWVLWAGYHNKNIFNGYSGYEPPGYLDDYIEFKDLDPGDIEKMNSYGLDYVIIDKQLSASRPELIERARNFFPERLYQGERYELFKIPD